VERKEMGQKMNSGKKQTQRERQVKKEQAAVVHELSSSGCHLYTFFSQVQRCWSDVGRTRVL